MHLREARRGEKPCIGLIVCNIMQVRGLVRSNVPWFCMVLIFRRAALSTSAQHV